MSFAERTDKYIFARELDRKLKKTKERSQTRYRNESQMSGRKSSARSSKRGK